MPDSSIMLPLCEILGITVNELLSGEKISRENYEKKAAENLLALKRKEETICSKKNTLVSIIFTATLLIGSIVCIICDIAISGQLTWSLIPVSSIIFAWIVAFPIILSGKKGIVGGLATLSIFLIPYFYIVSVLVNTKLVFSIGMIVSLITLPFLWLLFLLFQRLSVRRPLFWELSLLLSAAFIVIINAALSKILSEPILDMWDILSIFLLVIAAFAFFVYDHTKRKH